MSLLRNIYYRLSPDMRLIGRKIIFSPVDIFNTVTGVRQKYEPPKGDIYTGSGDFVAQGVHQLELLKEHIHLRPEDSVLDIGSGIGRTAMALTGYMNINGSYEGFDVVEKGVRWCNRKIKKDFPNFNFIYVPLKNDLYNNRKREAQNFKFPYEDNSFDKVFLFSVFTHMSVKEIAHYLCEIKRVLKPGGLCLSTFFIYSSQNEEMIASHSDFAFSVKQGNYRLMSNEVKSANMALKDELLDELIMKSKLEKIKTIEGFWKQSIVKNHFNYFQDIVILKS